MIEDDNDIEIRDFVKDKQGNVFEVSGWRSDTYFHGHIATGDEEIGRINWVINRSNNIMTIADLYIFEYIGYPPLWKRIFPFLTWSAPTNREKGIGDVMLNYIIEQAEYLKVEGIWGWIQSDDLEKTPYLPKFYQKHGFIVDEKMNIYRPVKSK